MVLGKDSTAADCAARCEKVSLCNGFHYYGQKEANAAGTCYMKTGVTKITKMNDKRDRFASVCGELVPSEHRQLAALRAHTRTRARSQGSRGRCVKPACPPPPPTHRTE